MKRAHITCWLFLLLWMGLLRTPQVAATMAPEYYERARQEAAYHVQVRVLSVNGPARTPGECAVTGEVVRVFRDRSGNLKQATRLAFTVSCRKSGDELMVGGTLWQDYDRLLHADYLEVFLNRTNGGYAVASWQTQIIEKPTAQPVMN